MSVLGALLGVGLTVFIFTSITGLQWLFWPLFIFCSIITLPFALISQSRDAARRRMEAREDKRHREQLEAIKQARALGEDEHSVINNLNIDARSVHYHDSEEKVQKRLFDKS